VLKDSHPSAGDPFHQGSVVLKEAGHVAPADSFTVAHLRRAGFVFVGRTNVPELCSWPSTEPVAYGPTHNPWDLARTAGGSSGGSGAAVAAGMVPVATGSDGGGSVRLPAAMGGIVGLKPARGRVSSGPDAGQHWGGLSTDGVLARTVRDIAGVFDVIAGTEVGDPYAPFGPAGPFAACVNTAPGRLRVGFCDHPPTMDAGDPDCERAVTAIASTLEELGHRVAAGFPDALRSTEFSDWSRVIVASSVAAEVARWERVLDRAIEDDELAAVNRMYRQRNRTLTAADYVEAERQLYRYGAQLVTWWDAYDVLVLPVLSVPPPPLGWFDLPGPDGKWPNVFNYLGQFNVSGQPAIALPAMWNDDGLPIGVQLVGAPGREDILIQVASQLEQARPWAHRHPPLA
jgi:amidase